MSPNIEFSKYERARIIGARGLQISMDAPLLVDMDEGDLDAVNYDPLKIAEKELDSGVLPISVNKPMPKRREESLDRIKVEEPKVSDAEKIRVEREEEKNIVDGGEMMGLTDSNEEPEADSITEESPEEDGIE
ncbi:MAG: DNA-directed RNA polymerase subunit K [Nanoarchaeota archaeon]|nr:DNA-directed RNA polymerase subunit K [Nanoarchaeota archaeon]